MSRAQETTTARLGPYPPHRTRYTGPNALAELEAALAAWRVGAGAWGDANLPGWAAFTPAGYGADDGRARKLRQLSLALGSLRDRGEPATVARVKRELERWAAYAPVPWKGTPPAA